MRIPITIACLLLFNELILAQSNAHKLSAKYVIDPAYSTTAQSPSVNLTKGAPWLYGYSEFECWRLQVMIKETKEAKLLVNYPGEHHKPYTKASYRIIDKNGIKVNHISFLSNADVRVIANGKSVYTSAAKQGAHIVYLDKSSSIKNFEIALSTTEEPPCLLISGGELSTNNKRWQWKAGDQPWQQPARFPQVPGGVYPHMNKLKPVEVLPVSSKNNLFDFGRELFAYVQINSGTKPEITPGESITEALDTLNKVVEQTTEVISTGPGKWQSKMPLALRYVYVKSQQPVQVSTGALFYPAQYEGAFACSDTLLNRVWINSAYTLRLCRNDFLIDGVKRDRLPWAGDLAMSLRANAFTFADREPVRRSLVALNRAGIAQKDINGILDYDMWWIISQNEYQRYYGDMAHLKREWTRIKETLNIINSKCDSLGFIDPKKAQWLFIDWVNFNKNSALQILWWWAQSSAVQLAERMNDQQAVDTWKKRAMLLYDKLHAMAWSKAKGAWMDDQYAPKEISIHANILAVVSGLAKVAQYQAIKEVLKSDHLQGVGTPYMGGFESIALGILGDNSGVIKYVKDNWGGMLAHTGTTTFWEGYDPAETGAKVYSFYGRPYAKSLCHAWSSGPAAFLPAVLLGVSPAADGWKVFKVEPKPSGLQWISAAIPTPHGLITVDIKNNRMTLKVPAGTTANWRGKLVKGPQVFETVID
ncbi:MAG TPA: alpha-L-rhamnosidase C-terminal domain-containing protein [Mucilaginibacter sp.]|nr:alpha-L-rhamnosidase C-terminal domain-containing protein [Mucilaginibacter sp.]